jgi:glycerate 2-kinase
VQAFRPAVEGGPDGPHYTIIAAGKAARGMAAAAARFLGRRVRAGLVIAPDTEKGSDPNSTEKGSDSFSMIAAGHPTPTDASEEAGRRALAIAKSVRDDETLLVLLSGGASSLMAVPAEGVTLADKARTTHALLCAGADIYALNTVRKHLSAIKGGWLAAATSATTIALAISDVVGDEVSVIGSGPTVADPSTFADSLRILDAHGGRNEYPPAVVSRLTLGARGALPETPKPSDPRMTHSLTRVIGGRHDAMRGAAGEARRRGYDVHVVERPIAGEAREAGRARLAEAAAATGDRPLCLISSGETTVRVTGTGRGGRNQEFALAAAEGVASLRVPATLASLGTDGVDGPTDAAGAVVDSTTISRALEAGLSPASFLANNDAYAFFHALGDLIHTGPTGTNVGDLQVILIM